MSLADIRARALERAGERVNQAANDPPPVTAHTDPFTWGARPPVKASPDLERIIALPRRPAINTATEAQALELTARLKRPAGTMTLRPLQAGSLLEIERTRGLFGAIGVGEGKTLISLLAAMILDVRTAVLLVPGSLQSKLLDWEFDELAKHWRLPNIVGHRSHFLDVPTLLHVISYDRLSRAPGTDTEGKPLVDLLDRIKPDLIIGDEVHSISKPQAARTKRFNRSMKARPATMFVGLSGTITQKSIRDYAHLARYALKKNAPVPVAWPVLEDWAAVLDSKNWDDDGRPLNPPGELARLCKPGEQLRSAFRRRLLETPGVVASGDGQLGTGLVIHERKIKVPIQVVRELAFMRLNWETPGGVPYEDALTHSRLCRQVACGLYLRWTWPKEEPVDDRREWLLARKDWHREVRDWLKGDASPGLDSPMLIARAAQAGRIPAPSWPRWRDVQDLCHPETEAVWLDEFLAHDAVEWGKHHVGIIWYEHEELGRRIAELGGWRLFGGGEQAADAIDREGRDGGHETIVASIRAHGTGRNLQRAFHKNLVTTPSSNGKTWEQLLGRTHRPGQPADEVEFWTYLHTPEMREALRSAIRDANYIQGTLGSSQKLTYATYSFHV